MMLTASCFLRFGLFCGNKDRSFEHPVLGFEAADAAVLFGDTFYRLCSEAYSAVFCRDKLSRTRMFQSSPLFRYSCIRAIWCLTSCFALLASVIFSRRFSYCIDCIMS